MCQRARQSQAIKSKATGADINYAKYDRADEGVADGRLCPFKELATQAAPCVLGLGAGLLLGLGLAAGGSAWRIGPTACRALPPRRRPCQPGRCAWAEYVVCRCHA